MKDSYNPDLDFGLDCVDPFDQDNDNLWIKLEHLGRYLFAADYLRPLKPACVADIACGLGYGLLELEKITQSVIGIDGSIKILEKAANLSTLSHTQFLQHDLDQPDWFAELRPHSVDAIVSFETLEHLIDPAYALANFSQLLTSQGVLICSVPNVLYEPREPTGLPTNPVHKQLFNGRSLIRLLEQHGFSVHYRVGQAASNILYKRESQLLKHRTLRKRIGNYASLHHPDLVRHLSYLLAYPSAEDIEGSYSLIVVAQKT